MRAITRVLLLLSLLLAGCTTPAQQPDSRLPAASPTAAPTRSPLPSASPTSTPAATSTPEPARTPQPTAFIALTGPLSGPALLQALRAGGYVIYFRHATTDPLPDDASPVDLGDCASQRHMSAAGVEQARQIGQGFQRLDIPVGRVLASPFCRTQDTARLAFGRVEAEPALENLETAPDEAERERRTAGLRRLLSSPPGPDANTILVAHGFNLSAAAQVSVPEGGAAIFRPRPGGGFDLVATLAPAEWAALE